MSGRNRISRSTHASRSRRLIPSFRARHGGELLSRLHLRSEQILDRDLDELTGLVADAARVKVDVVASDETERGARAFLNYGHTLGHALEALGEYRRFTHGDAVAIGMMFAAALGAELGHKDLIDQHRDLLDAFGLPSLGAGFEYEQVEAMWLRDKKYQAGVRFVVLEDLGKPALVRDVPERALRAAYEAVR